MTPLRARPPGRRAAFGALVALLLALAALPAAAGGVAEAEKALAARRFAEAADGFRSVLEQDAGHRGAALGLARAALAGRLGRETLQDAQAYLEKLVKVPAGEVEARLLLGEVYLALAPSESEPKYTEFALRDAEAQFSKVLALSPGHAEAQVGLAKVRYNQGDADAAAAILDPLLAGKAPASASYWRGLLYYEQAVASYREEPRAERTLALFRKARQAFEVATQADPAGYDGWMQLAYAAQYLGEVPLAEEAYVKAAGLDALSPYPLRGLKALKTGDEPGYLAALERTAKACPANAAVHLALGEAHLDAGRFEAAEKALGAYLERSPRAGRGWTLMGRARLGQGKEEAGVKALEKALELEPDDVWAADELDRRLQARHTRAAPTSLKAARECEADYERLSKAARNNPFVRNSAGFILREAYGAHPGDGSWLPVLKASVRFYEEAARIVDDRPEEEAAAAPWATRYGWAQITSDTGLMFQFYEPTFDAEKAEAYYRRALRLTGNGYFDAWNNLHRLLLQLGRHQDAYDLAAQAAEGLSTEQGQPHTTGRGHARAEMARLVKEGKAKAD